MSKGVERCVRGHTAGAPVRATDGSAAGAPVGIRSLAMPFLNCLHGQRAGEDSPTQQRREGGGGGRGGTGAHFLTIPAAPGCLPSRGHPLDMESGVPQPTLSQVLTNPSTPAGGRGASVVPQPLVGSGTQGGACTSPFPGGSSARELCGGRGRVGAGTLGKWHLC